MGLALKTKANVIAYDIDPIGRDLCRLNAIYNNVLNKIEIKGEITSYHIENYSFMQKTLIICDIEGTELDLFNTNNIKNLIHTDLLIEVHDFMFEGDNEASRKLKMLFKKTHEIHSKFSISDRKKARLYRDPPLNKITLEERMPIVSEYRPEIMEWLFLESNTTLKKY